MKSFFFGKSPVTSIIGYIIAGLTVMNDLMTAGETNGWKIGLAVAMAVLGRVAADAGQTQKK
jgi:hypothetical protein